MLKKSDICTNINEPEDKDILTRPLFAVNMRLFRTSPKYKALVLAACDYIAECCQHEQDGRESYIGFSGANAGVPWDIIAVKRANGTGPIVMLNTALEMSQRAPMKSYESCGSIPNGRTFMVDRDPQVVAIYYNREGQRSSYVSDGFSESTVIQHEVDHNDGILLTDRAIK